MDRRLEARLRDEFPAFFQELYGPVEETCMHRGCECGDGSRQLREMSRISRSISLLRRSLPSFPACTGPMSRAWSEESETFRSSTSMLSPEPSVYPCRS